MGWGWFEEFFLIMVWHWLVTHFKMIESKCQEDKNDNQ